MFQESRAYLHSVDEFNIILADEAASARLGQVLSQTLAPGDIVCLSGPLGAGKTTIARAAIKELSGAVDAPSPTYNLVETYDVAPPAGPYQLWHFDLYRLEAVDDVYELGFEDAISDGTCLIEWPERIAALIPKNALLIRIEPHPEGRRALIRSDDHWRNRLEALKAL